MYKKMTSYRKRSSPTSEVAGSLIRNKKSSTANVVMEVTWRGCNHTWMPRREIRNVFQSVNKRRNSRG